MEHPKYAVYVLYSLKDRQFYIGYTTNFESSMVEHAQVRTISTACRRPFVPIFCEYYFAKQHALRRELYFKSSDAERTLNLM